MLREGPTKRELTRTRVTQYFPTSLILSPTRELAMQINEESQRVGLLWRGDVVLLLHGHRVSSGLRRHGHARDAGGAGPRLRYSDRHAGETAGPGAARLRESGGRHVAARRSGHVDTW